MLSLTCCWRAARSKGFCLGDSFGVVVEKVGRRESGGSSFCEGVGVIVGVGAGGNIQSRFAMFLLTCCWRVARSKGSCLGNFLAVMEEEGGRGELGFSSSWEGVVAIVVIGIGKKG